MEHNFLGAIDRDACHRFFRTTVTLLRHTEATELFAPDGVAILPDAASAYASGPGLLSNNLDDELGVVSGGRTDIALEPHVATLRRPCSNSPTCSGSEAAVGSRAISSRARR